MHRLRPAASLAVLAWVVLWVGLSLVDTPVRTPAGLLLMLGVPAAAVAVPMRSLDLLSQLVVGLGAAIAVNAVVAQTMLATGTWSVPGGVIAVMAVSAAAYLAVKPRHRDKV